MAKTSKYGFSYTKSLSPNVENPMRLEVILANSAGPITVGDAVKWSSGYAVGCAADYAMLGIVEGFVDKNGKNIFESSFSGTGTKSGDDTYTASGTNQTVDQVKAVVNIDTNALFFAYANGTLTAAMVGQWFNGAVIDGTYVDGVEYSTAQGAWSVGTQQFQLIELVTTLGDGSSSTTTGLFRIGRSQLLNDYTI